MLLDWNIIILLILLGLILSTIATIAGIGGGSIMVPIMVLIIGIPFHEARDTSTFIILCSSGVGFISYLKQGRTDIKISLIFAIFSILGGVSCWVLLMFVEIPNDILRIVFGYVLIVTAANMAYKIYKDRNIKNKTEDIEEFIFKEFEYRHNLLKGIPFFFLAGFASYLIGIGGGIIFGPALHIVFGFPIHYATGISTSMVFFTAIFNTILKALYGEINYVIGFFLIIGSLSGAILGAKISKKMPKKMLQAFITILLLFLAISMLA